jgi:hypothetical protein
VEDGSLGVFSNKLIPPCILCRINLMKSDWHFLGLARFGPLTLSEDQKVIFHQLGDRFCGARRTFVRGAHPVVAAFSIISTGF